MGQPNWFIDILRTLFRLIDWVAYWLVDNMYQLFIMISEVGVFSPATISKFAGRIYALLGVFMLFKVSFSLITYILNPDSFADKNKGMGKLLTNFFVVLIGIIAVPYVFQAAYRLQAIVLEENVIGNLIMGINSDQTNETQGSSYIKEGGNRMAFTTLSAFIRLNPHLVSEECSNNPVITKDGSLVLSDTCNNEKSDALYTKMTDDLDVGQFLVQAYKENNVNYFTTTDLVTMTAVDNKGVEYYIMDYTMLISAVAGGFLAWIFLLFCIDIATRSVKLGFLQLIAPIPIISYIDPKGKDMFNKWLKECGKTYADLFIRLVAIYFVIFIISELTRNGGGFYNVVSNDVQQVNSFGDLLVRIFIIFGALMFAKQLPDLISNILGVKFSGGGFTLNPLKKLGQSPYAAGLVGAVGGAVGGLAANAWATKGNWKGKGFKEGMKNVGSILAGGSSAGFRGMYRGLKSDGKGSVWGGASQGIKASTHARYRRDVNQAAGYGVGRRALDAVDRFANVKNKAGGLGLYDQQMKTIKREMDNLQSQEQALRNAQALHMAENPNIDFGGDGRRLIRERYATLQAVSANWEGFEQEMSTWTDEQRAQRQTSIDAYNEFRTSYDAARRDMDAVNRYESYGERIQANDAEYERLRKEYGRYEDVSKARELNQKKQ